MRNCLHPWIHVFVPQKREATSNHCQWETHSSKKILLMLLHAALLVLSIDRGSWWRHATFSIIESKWIYPGHIWYPWNLERKWWSLRPIPSSLFFLFSFLKWLFAVARLLILDPQDFTIQEIFGVRGEDWPALDGRSRYHFPSKSLSAPVPRRLKKRRLQSLVYRG